MKFHQFYIDVTKIYSTKMMFSKNAAFSGAGVEANGSGLAICYHRMPGIKSLQ